MMTIGEVIELVKSIITTIIEILAPYFKGGDEGTTEDATTTTAG